ncbi:MAG: GNAT family N-acetyltransferase [Acidimicrobiia bacterium]|nr:GNAT family N-acetyltransferase [Acidimicrobiia bacterium]
MSSPYPTLPRMDEIGLRLPTDGDVERITEICRDPDVQAWTTVPSPYTEADAEAWISETTRKWERGEDDLGFVAEDLASGRILGSVGVRARRPDRRIADIGYLVASEARGRGIAPLLVDLVRTWTVRAWPVERFEIGVYSGNARSERVAEKCGFRREGVLRLFGEQRGELRDVVMFSWLPGDDEPGG